MQVVKQYCVENRLDGITMFDTADPQENVEIASDDVIRGANNSCYKYKWIDPDTGIEKTSYLCPEIVLFHNSNDSEWENLQQRYPEVTNIGTRKITIMGMVDLIHNERKLPRAKISNMFDILFSNYLTYVPQYNQQQVNMRTGKQIGEITIGYANTNIYKMIVHNNGSEEDQNILFELITFAWSNMILNRGLYCITGDVPIDMAPNLKFFDADQYAEVLADIPHLSNPHDWIKLYSRINIDFDLESRLQRSPLYSSENIFQRILNAHNITPENIYKLYIISCLTIIPEIRQRLTYDIIDVLEGTVGEQQIQDFYNYCINNVIKEQCTQYFQQRNDFIFSKFNIPFVLNTQEFYSLIQLININNSIPTFIFTKNIISFINTESESFKTLRAYLLDPLIQVYNNKLVEFFSFYSNQIMVIINTHFRQEMIQNSDVQNLLVLFTQKFTQDRFQEFMTKIFNSYKILEYRLFMEDIDHMIIDLIKFFWDIFTEYMTTTKMVTINGIPTKEYMDNLFTTSQRTLYPASSFYEVLTTDVDMNAYSPLYYHSSNKNVVYVYLENEIIDINGLWEYYHKNKDSDILDLIYELKELRGRNYDSATFSPETEQIFKSYATDIPKQRGIFLKSICSDSGVCMAFGRQTKRIKKHFNGLVDFEYAISPIKTIGEVSTNGFIKEITYERDGYKANAILKSSSKIDTDNLLFEYLVGKYLNKLCLVFPCFIETYGWYQYKNNIDWLNMRDNIEVSVEDLKESLEIGDVALENYKATIDANICYENKTTRLRVRKDCTEMDYLLKVACAKSKYISILTQHINNAKSIQSMIILKPPHPDADFSYKDLLNVLYQIYMPLASVSETFTHYDLHMGNILIYEPVPGKYIDYKYVLEDDTIVEFKCRYIAKIIDYGRSFFKDYSNEEISGSSKSIYDTICKNIPECNGRNQASCGEDQGFSSFDSQYGIGYSISSSVRNTSHDLLLIYQVKKILKHPYLQTKEKNPLLQSIFEKSEYGNEVAYEEEERRTNKRKDEFGTVEKHDISPLLDDGLPEKINNVIDAHNALKTQVIKYKTKNDLDHVGFTSLGSLTIYQSGRSMEFKPN
jgi:hypothetical protein